MTVRVFDTFPFDGELDLLEHRLRETYDLVDAFVIVEAAQTYRGTAKPFTFEENKSRFGWAADKIRHVKLASLGPASATPRERAAAQRNSVLLALRDAAPEDLVLLLDVDEMPSPALIERLRRDGLARPRRLAMTRHYGFADTLGPRSPCCPTGVDPFAAATPPLRPGRWGALTADWYGHSGAAAPVAAVREAGAFALRFGLADAAPLPDAGRHYSSVDPAAALARKLGRVFHAEYDGPRETSPEHLGRCRRYWVHHRGWWLAERPQGELPNDIARLLAASPVLAAGPPPARLIRRLVRSWAWLRLSPAMPGRLVAVIDRRFETLLPLLLPPLLLCEGVRAAAAMVLGMLPRRVVSPLARH